MGPRLTDRAVLGGLGAVGYVRRAYDEALRCAYLWHELGDLRLIV